MTPGAHTGVGVVSGMSTCTCKLEAGLFPLDEALVMSLFSKERAQKAISRTKEAMKTSRAMREHVMANITAPLYQRAVSALSVVAVTILVGIEVGSEVANDVVVGVAVACIGVDVGVGEAMDVAVGVVIG
jgi:hypothetical protein